MHSFAKSVCLDQKFFITFHYFSANCCSKTFLWGCSHAVTSKVQPVLYGRLVAQWDSTGFWFEPCSNFSWNATIHCHKKHLSSPVQGLDKISDKNKLHWTEVGQTILHSEFHSDQAYSRLWKISDCNIDLKWCNFEEKVICYQLWDRKIPCQRFDWMLQSSSGWVTSIKTGAVSQNIGKLKHSV